MLTPDQINDIHRLHWVEKWSLRKIARHLHIGRRTFAKYLRHAGSGADPSRSRQQARSLQAGHQRAAPEGPDRQCAGHRAASAAARLRRRHHDRQRLPSRRPPELPCPPRLRARGAGRRANASMSIGATSARSSYNGATRKLYAFCLVECHSRKMYLEFTHSQTFETFVRCHIHAFSSWAGAAARSGSTISPRPSPNTMATWCASTRASSPSLANAVSFRVPVMWRRPGKKEKWNAPSDMSARTSGRCAPSRTWPM